MISHFSAVLVIPLQWFNNIGWNVSKAIGFPLKSLDFSLLACKSHFEHDPIYDLFAVNNHMGSPLYGHYIVNCLDPESKRWYTFNDPNASQIDVEKFMSSSYPYLILQIKRHLSFGCYETFRSFNDIRLVSSLKQASFFQMYICVQKFQACTMTDKISRVQVGLLEQSLRHWVSLLHWKLGKLANVRKTSYDQHSQLEKCPYKSFQLVTHHLDPSNRFAHKWK